MPNQVQFALKENIYKKNVTPIKLYTKAKKWFQSVYFEQMVSYY